MDICSRTKTGRPIVVEQAVSVRSHSHNVALVDLVDLPEIASRLKVKTGTAHAWRNRGLLPDPTWDFAGGPVWDWHAIEAWATETGRL